MADQAETQSVEERLAARFEEQAAPEETASTPEPEFADIEYAGAKYQIPVALKEAFMKNDDYTRKTQDLAEQRKTYDHLRSTVEQRQLEASFQDSIATESRDLNVIEAYLAELSKANWAGMSAEQMLKQKIEMDQVKERREQIKASIDEKRSQFHEGLKGKLQELRAKAREIASKSIKDYSEDTEKEMRKFALSQGLSEREYDNVVLDPRSESIIWKAMQFDKVQAGTSQATAQVAKVLKPGAATERMPEGVKAKLQFNKDMKAAKTSGDKARVIEGRLEGIFARR